MNKNPGKNRIKIRERIDPMTMKNEFVEIMFVKKIMEMTEMIVNRKRSGDDFLKIFIV